MLRKSELMLRIIDLEMLCDTYDMRINELEKSLKKLEKPTKKTTKAK